MKLETKHPPLLTFSLASLTDIVLLLLIFFLLASTYIIQPGVKVELPTSVTAQVVEEKSIVVSVTKEGTVWVNEERSSVEGMGALLRRLIISGGAQTVIFRADRNIPFQLAVQVMDRIRAAGGEKILIATVTEEE